MAAILNFPLRNKSFEGELHIHRDIINGELTMYTVSPRINVHALISEN